MHGKLSLALLLFFVGVLLGLTACYYTVLPPNAANAALTPALAALWQTYQHTNIQDGRVVSWDEGGITTSEGQSYALLRSVECNDPAMFDKVWQWTQTHLQVRLDDNLFSWKWKDQVIGQDAATDADTDIALALILASRRFSRPDYLKLALPILESIWKHEIVAQGNDFYVTAGNWSVTQNYPVLHVGYFAPYAYSVFAEVDPSHPWKALIKSSYDALHWIYFEKRLALPPEVIYLDRQTGNFLLQLPGRDEAPVFSYDVFPIFWRVAVDEAWNRRGERRLRRAMLSFFQSEWKAKGKFLDRYSVDGHPASQQEGMPLYATLHSLATLDDPQLADQIFSHKLSFLRANARAGKDTPYYLANWLWFDDAFEYGYIQRYGA